MLGFAVIDDNPHTGSLAVWLTSHTDPQRAGHTNAVLLETSERDLTRIGAMVSDRYLVLSARTVDDARGLTGLDGSAVDIAALGKETLAAQEDLEAQFRAHLATRKTLVEPRWPAVPEEVLAWFDQSLDTAIALQTANHVAALWNAWLSTESERVSRVKFFKPDTPEIRPLPPEFEASYTPMPMGVTVGAR